MRQIGGEVGDEIGDLFAFGYAPQRNAARGKGISFFARELHVARHRIDEAGPVAPLTPGDSEGLITEVAWPGR